MRRVVLESPYAGKDIHEIARNTHYARACMRDCLLRGEAPIASHLLYTQEGILDDTVPEERRIGIAAGFAWNELADATVVYTDYGISDGMREGIERAQSKLRIIEYRRLPSLVALTEGACSDHRDKLLLFFDTGEATDELKSHIEACDDCNSAMQRADGQQLHIRRQVFQTLRELDKRK